MIAENFNKMPIPTVARDIIPTAPEFYTKHWLPIPKNAVSMLSASGGVGKSFFSIQIACQIIKEDPTRRVLLWLSEDPRGQSRKRLDDILSRVMCVKDAKQYIDNIDIIGSDDSTPHITLENLNAFEEMSKQYEVIVIDPLIAFYAGEENNNGEARRFMNVFNYLAQKNSQSILFIHHHSKSSKDNKGSTRGAGAFVDASRAVFELGMIEDSQERKLNVTKDNWGVRMHLKNGKEFTVLPFEIVFEDAEGKEESDNNTGGQSGRGRN